MHHNDFGQWVDLKYDDGDKKPIKPLESSSDSDE